MCDTWRALFVQVLRSHKEDVVQKIWIQSDRWDFQFPLSHIMTKLFCHRCRSACASDPTTYPVKMIIGPRQANLVLIAYASSEGSGETAHPRSLARTFAARSYKQWVKRNLQTESQISGPSEWWACAVKICHDGMLEDTNSLDGAQLIIPWAVSLWPTCSWNVLNASETQILIITFRKKKKMIKRAASWENLFMPYANNKGADSRYVFLL